MKIQSTIRIFACVLSINPVWGAITIYNQQNPPDASALPGGGWGTYAGFSLRLDDEAFDVIFSEPDSSPMPATVYLNELLLRHAGDQGGVPQPPIGDWTNVLLKVYTSNTPSVATYVGETTNTNDMSATGGERNVSYLFDFLALQTNVTYFFYFANTVGNSESIAWSSGRLRVSNDVDHTFESGTLMNNGWSNQDSAYDPIFAASVSSVPEPGVAFLGGIGLLALLRRHRADSKFC